MSDSGALRSPAAFRRLALGIALLLALAECLLFAWAWRLDVLLAVPGSPHAAPAFVLFGTALTLQAMGIVAVAWMLVALSRTELTWDHRVRLEHPWRRWSGEWTDVRRAWWRGGWLTIEIGGQWRRWYLRVPDREAPELAIVRAALPSDVWLDGRVLQQYYFTRVLPLFLVIAGVGGLVLVATLHYLSRLQVP